MALKGEWAAIGDVKGFVARPAGPPPWPAILIVHAVIGIDEHIEELTERFAADGYYAVTPDIYANDPGYKNHRHEHIEMAAHIGADPEKLKEELAHHPEETRTAVMKAREWMSARQGHTYIDTIRATYDHLHGRRDVRAIGAIGFCMGGRLVGELAATGAEMAAGIIHYGGPPKLDQIPKIVTPLEGHYASTDTPITSKIPAFTAAMKAAGKEFSYYVYEADHGFTLRGTKFPEAARLALSRSKAFLAERLRPAALAGAAE